MKKTVFFVGLLLLSVVGINSYGQELKRVYNGNRWGFVDKNGKTIIPHIYYDTKDFSEGLAAVRLFRGRWGFIDTIGNEVIPPRFLCAKSFSEGLAAVGDSYHGQFPTWIFIDKNGNYIVPFKLKYKEVSDFSDGYAMVQRGEFWGAIDKNGVEIVPIIYNDIHSAKMEAEKKRVEEKPQTDNNAFSTFSEKYIATKLNEWLQKGEFEKTADWQQRVNDHSTARKINELRKEAEQVYIAEYSKKNPVGTITLGGYNADKEVFLIKNDVYGDWLEPVPFNEAQSFKSNWNNIAKTLQFIVIDNKIAFAGYTFSPLEVVVANNTVAEQKETQTTPIASQTKEIEKPNTPPAPKEQTTEIKQSEQVAEEQEVVSKTIRTGSTETENVPNKAGDVGFGVSPTISVGGMLRNFGFCGKLQVNVVNQIRLEGSFTHYLPKTVNILGLNIEYNMWEANLNMQTIFTKNDKFLPYSLLGFGAWGVKASVLDNRHTYEEESATCFTLNIGFGFDVKLYKRLYFNSEAKQMILLTKPNFESGDNLKGRIMISAGFILRF